MAYSPGKVPMRFRKTEAVNLWSACVAGNFNHKQLEAAIAHIALLDGHRHSGFVSKNPSSNGLTYTRTRYPRQKYGITPIEACQAGMELVAAKLNVPVIPESQTTGLRVVLGLLEGYDKTASIHKSTEVAQFLGSSALVSDAEILAVRSTKSGVSIYNEPAAIIRGTSGLLTGVYELAESFKQERFTIEDFDKHRSWIVETPYCTEPDK